MFTTVIQMTTRRITTPGTKRMTRTYGSRFE